MRILNVVVCLLLALFINVPFTQADTYPEVVFDNSLVKGVYAKSAVEYTGGAWVENLNKHLLVSDSLFFTPGNALSLRYKSSPIGHWHVDLKYSRQKFNYEIAPKDFLVLKMYIKSESTEKSDLPRIQIKQHGTETDLLNLASYVEDFGYNMWLNVKIPIDKFLNLNFDKPITAICFSQNRATANTHHLFIDQVEFLSKPPSEVKLTSPAILSEIEAYDKQVSLKWQLPLTPSIRYIKIYRSEDNENFVPVAMRPIFMQGCLDYVSDVNRTYYYKIAWVDYNYVESPFSAVREVTTKKLNTDQLLRVVQGAHLNYFIENYDINSGMYVPYRMKKQAVVSVKETGNAILSLLIAAENKQLNKQMALGRISKIVYFLMRSQNRYGVFPAYFDGRTGLPHYHHNDTDYDVLATSSIIESLLVARQYFKGEDELEVDLRNRITKLWENIQWNKLIAKGTDDILVEKVSIDDSVANGITLGGVNESINSYLLAMSAPKHNIPLSAYEHGIKNRDIRLVSSYKRIDSLATDTLAMVMENFRMAFNLVGHVSLHEDLPRVSIMQDTSLYGVTLPFGYEGSSLLEYYKPFFTIQPRMLADKSINFEEAIRNYIIVRKRRDNEIGVGSTSSDIWGFYQLNDSVGNYRINPSIAPASMFLLPEEGRKSMMAMYENYGESFFTEYGFRAWLDLRNNDVSDEYFAANQAANAILMENARSGMIWKLYQEIPEIKVLFGQLFDENQKENYITSSER